MNIKSVVNHIHNIEPGKKAERTQEVRSEQTADRDADGKREQEGEPEKEHLSDEEMREALEALKKVPGVQKHNLAIRVEDKGATRVIYIVDPYGKVVRRMTEAELWTLTKERDETKPTGQILNKAM